MRAITNGNLARGVAAVIACGAFMYAFAHALAQEPGLLPPDTPTVISGVETVCTGVGTDAREDPRWSTYPLKIEIVGKGGQYLANMQITVNKDAKIIVQAECGGPWLLLKLSPGRYQVSATVEGTTVSSPAYALASGQGRVILRFPELGGVMDNFNPQS
jgi:hypothetical protein